MTRNRLYSLILTACAGGYAWLYFFFLIADFDHLHAEMCVFKRLTNIPCPSCGSTRSVQLIFNGEFFRAFIINPFGYIIVFIITVVPAWIFFDLISAKATFYNFYLRAERIISKKSVAIPLLVLVFFNWIWNIFKGL
jgi:hypothetical protein